MKITCPIPECEWHIPGIDPAWRAEADASLDRHLSTGHTVTEALTITRTPRPCNKIGYPTREAADKALVGAWQSNGYRRAETRSYQCPQCGYHHLTSKPDKQKATR
jgi:hypothetical protein